MIKLLLLFQTVLVGGPEPPPLSAGESGDQSPALVAMTTVSPTVAAATAAVHSVNGNETESQKSLKRAMETEDVYFLDASKEGNVSRFFNVSHLKKLQNHQRNYKS